MTVPSAKDELGHRPPRADFAKNQSLEGLRGIAALGVVVGHFLFALLPSIAAYSSPGGTLDPRLPFVQWASLPFATVLFNGGFQVSIFFALSGFVLTQRVVRTGDRSGLPGSAVRRYPRLVLPALLSVLFAWCLLKVGMMHTDLAVPIGGAGWVLQAYDSAVPFSAAVYQGLIGAPFLGETSLNDPLWTIRIELIGSLLLFLSYGLFGPGRPVRVALVFCVLAVVIAGPTTALFYYATLLVGSFINYAIRRSVAPSRAATVGMAIVGIVLGAADFSPLYASYQGVLLDLGLSWSGAKVLSQSVGACLVVYALISSPTGIAARLLGTPVAAWLGRISFSVYLVHWPIICSVGFTVAFVAERHLGWTFAQALALSGISVLLIVLAVAEIFTRLVDAPSTQLSVALADRVFGRAPAAAISQHVRRLAGACLCIGFVLVLGVWTTRIATYTDAVVPPKFSQSRLMAIHCRPHSRPIVRIAMYGDNTQMGESWVDGRYKIVDANVPALLGTVFCEDFGGRVAVSNHAVKGITTADLLLGRGGVQQDWQAEMMSSDADVVVINTAINDVSLPGIDYSLQYQQWAEVIRVAQAHGMIVVVESGNPVADERQNIDLWSATHNQKAVCASSGAIFVDQYGMISKAVPDWRKLLSDKVNPGERLYRLKASNIYTAIKPTVERLVQERSANPRLAATVGTALR